MSATEDYAELNPGKNGRRIKVLNQNGTDVQVVGLAGVNDAGNIQTVPVTPEGHVEVALHSPRLPFGSVHTERLSPVFQVDGVYGINTALVNTSTGLSFGTGANSGSVTSTGNKLVCATGTTQYSFASLQSRRRLRYRPGQGVVGRFAGFFSAPVASSILVAGIGTAESGFFFGYNGTAFGILHSTGGVREIHTFTVTTASTATNDYVVTLPNTATVTVTATNNSSTTKTAYEIARGTFPGWKAEQRGATVIFLADSAAPSGGSFSLAQTGAGTPAAGTDATTLAGVAPANTWIPQSSWNGDVMDGSGSDSNPSGGSLDPTKGNVYQIGIQYLGFGSISFQIETVPANGNNPEFVTVHTIRFPNSSTSVSMSQPSFPFTMEAYSSGSTTNVSVSISSFAGFVEGDIENLGPRSSYYNNSGVTSSTSAYVPLFTARNDYVFAGRANQAVSHIISAHGAAKSNTGLTTYYLIRNATLTGTPNFTQFSTQSSTYWDTAATGCSFASNSQVLWSGTLAESSDFNYAFADQEITLQPGESVTLAVRSVTATATCVGSLNTREDQ